MIDPTTAALMAAADRIDELEAAAGSAWEFLAAICRASDFDQFSSPAMRDRFRFERDSLAGVLVAGGSVGSEPETKED